MLYLWEAVQAEHERGALGSLGDVVEGDPIGLVESE